MKPKQLITILPIIAFLTGCGQSELNLQPQTADRLANPSLTATPNQLVVYPDDRPSIPDGAGVYAQNCASCHGATGGGGTATGKFDQQWAQRVKPVDLYRMVAFGETEGHKHPGGGFVAKLSPRELWNVTVYTRSLGQPPLTDAEIAAVDPVFGSNCAVCHGTKGDGDGPLMRNLEPMPANFQRFDRFFNRTDDVLFDHIANGIRWEGMPNFLGKKDVKKGVTFDEAYIRKLVQYVHKYHVNNAPVLSSANVKPVTPVKPAEGDTASGGALGAPATGGKDGSKGTAAPTDAKGSSAAGSNSH